VAQIWNNALECLSPEDRALPPVKKMHLMVKAREPVLSHAHAGCPSCAATWLAATTFLPGFAS
jgi:hypothetical protein